MRPFHLAIPVHDLNAARQFYGGVLGCPEGRSHQTWIDFDLFGHQLIAHLASSPTTGNTAPVPGNHVDGHLVPVPHFGIVLNWAEWHEMVEMLRATGAHFIVEPHLRFAGEVGEQATFFIADPSGNALGFKAFRDPSQIFART
jgi:extradiol dioxygenase family protein